MKDPLLKNIMETKKNFYFFKTVKEKGEIRVVALDKQKESDGKEVKTAVKVSCPKSIRSMYEIGTIFVGDSIKFCKKGFYTTRNFRKLTGSMTKECECYKTIYYVTDFKGFKKETLLEKISADPKFKCPTPKTDGFYMKDGDWKLLIRNIKKHVNTLILGPTGCGKCLGKDTPILMYDGSIKPVQDVVPGDLLMGPDSNPRKVLSTTTGREELFRITPKKGDSWVCNKSHILSLKRANDGTSLAGSIDNVEIGDYLKWSKTRKTIYKQWRTGVEFKEIPVDLDPYFLGLWLGDGNTKMASVCTADQEIVDYLNSFAKSIGCTITVVVESSAANTYYIVQKDVKKGPGNHTEIMKRLLKYDLIGNKHIPNEFLHNTRENRLRLFAGLIDTDGNYRDGYYEYCTKLDNLKDDMVYLSRSLGYYVNCRQKIVNGKKYWALGISGNFEDVPVLLERKKAKKRRQRKSVLVTGISVESIGEGDYYGFTIDGDHLFMLGDFTVTHNTSCIQLICNRIGVPLEIFDMSTIIDPISSLLGVHRISEGKSIFDFAKFTQAIQKPGVILFDELNRSSLASGNVILSCLDQRRTLYVEIAGSKDIREIKVHPDVTFIATANVGSEYTGANSAMDRALLNRFFPLELGNIPSGDESEVLMYRTKIEKKDSDLIVKVANNIRSLYNKQEISLSLSIRETLMVAELVSDGWTLGNAMEMIYLPLYEGTKADGERSTIYKTISSY